MTAEPLWRTRLIRAVAVLTVAYSAYYLWWRWTASLNPDAMWFSLPLVLAETWGWLNFIGFTFTAWSLKHRAPVPAPEGLSVAVFVTTCGEPISVLRKTVVAAREIRYPHTTYILDDGESEEVRELAADMGVSYLSRPTREHAKAGNLNYALKHTTEDFILQLDADHVPLPRILDRLLGYFADPKVAFVQSPQDFYNLDSFTHVVDYEHGRVWEEQRIFFNIIQPGKDSWNAAFFCGSCGVVRRAALTDLGGFSTQTITEDVETSLLLHARGWRSAYVEESLAYGLSPGTARAYNVQRLRWGQGSMQILRKFNPLLVPGLTLPQRLLYLSSLTHYFDGIQRLLFIAAPFIFFFTGVLPIRAADVDFLVRFFPYIILVLLSFELLARGNGYVWISERFAMAKWPTYILSIWGLFAKHRLRFAVTPKGRERTPVGTYLPQLILLLLTPLAIGWAVFGLLPAWPTDFPLWRSPAFYLNSVWLVWNAYFALLVVRRARRLEQHEDYRFRDEVPVTFRIPDRVGADAMASIGVTREIAPAFVRLVTVTPLSRGDELELDLPLSTGTQSVRGFVEDDRSERRAGLLLHEYLVALHALPVSAQIAIERHCLHHAVPALTGRLRQSPDVFEDFRLWLRERRSEPRSVVRFPVQVGLIESGRTNLSWRAAVLEDMCSRGARVVIEHDVPENAWVRIQVPGADFSTHGMVTRSDQMETPLGCRWSLGLELTNGEAQPGARSRAKKKARAARKVKR